MHDSESIPMNLHFYFKFCQFFDIICEHVQKIQENVKTYVKKFRKFSKKEVRAICSEILHGDCDCDVATIVCVLLSETIPTDVCDNDCNVVNKWVQYPFSDCNFII